MAKITRAVQKIFASNAGGSGVAEPGSTADGSTVYTTNPVTIQSDAFVEGLAAMVIAGTKRLPVYEEINAVYYVLSRQLAYLFQDGIADWNAETTYYQYSIVRKTGTYELYGSIINDNLNNALPAAVTDSNWTYLGTLANLAGGFLPTTGGTLTGALTMSGAAINPAAEVTVTTSGGNTWDFGAAASNNCVTSGGGTITSFGTGSAGNWRLVRINSTATISMGSSIIGPAGISQISMVTTPGDYMLITCTGTTNWRICGYWPFAGTPAGGYVAAYKKLAVTWASTTTLTVSADELVAYDSNALTRGLKSVSATINCATTGANGLDTGSLANNTWYYVYAIYNPSTATTACLASTSSTAPTLPSGYTFATKPISAFRTDGSATITGFRQRGNKWQHMVGSNLTAARVLASGSSGSPTTPTWTATAVGNFVPTAIAAGINLYLSTTSGSQQAGAAPNNSYGVFNSTTNAPPLCATNAAGGQVMGEFLLESTDIYYYGGGSEPVLFCLGFTINL